MYILTSNHILVLPDSDVAQIRRLLFIYKMIQEITNCDKNGILNYPVQKQKRNVIGVNVKSRNNSYINSFSAD